MVKKAHKYDFIFIIAMLLLTAYYFILIFHEPYLKDEVFYPIIPLRLIGGDSLIQHEGHLTQFSSLFQYLPVKIWLLIKGSTEGIILYLRFLYLFVHAIISVLVYVFFRKSGIWSVVAAVMFFAYIPYGALSLCYTSMYMIFWLLFSLCLILSTKTNSPLALVFAVFWFGCSCVCSPMLCSLFFVYLIFVLLWPRKEKIITSILQRKEKTSKKRNKKPTNIVRTHNNDIIDNFFTIKSLAYITCGICIIALIAIAFFFATGGTIPALIKNLPIVLACSEYSAYLIDFWKKTYDMLKTYTELSLYLPFLLPAFLIAIRRDKNRNIFSHKVIYLISAAILSVIYMLGVYFTNDPGFYVLTLPFSIVSLICYILTENKNKLLFYLLWCPAIISATLQAFFSNTVFLSLGLGLTICNIAGVFFIHDICKELTAEYMSSKQCDPSVNKKANITKKILVIVMCLDIVFLSFMFAQRKVTNESLIPIENGPYAGLLLKEDDVSHYNITLKDVETVKTIVKEDEPVLIYTRNLWTYLCIDRPFAINTAWLCWIFFPEDLKLYYESNPDKIPAYVYLSFESEFEYEMYLNKMSMIFEYDQIKLSDGLLLKVNKYTPIDFYG